MLRYLFALTATGIGLFALIKPVHIDDTVVLHVAENIFARPVASRSQASFSGWRRRSRWQRSPRTRRW
jgi:hypothetical protein